eukprot:3588429-Rhodomonas_salina.1
MLGWVPATLTAAIPGGTRGPSLNLSLGAPLPHNLDTKLTEPEPQPEAPGPSPQHRGLDSDTPVQTLGTQ